MRGLQAASEDRVVTLVALEAPSESYLMDLNAASEASVWLEQDHRVLAALAPIVSTPRAISASVKISDLLRGRA